MKKKLLFIIPSMSIGGAEKSLVTLLSLISPDRADIDLFLFSAGGEFLSQLPPHVRILEHPQSYTLFTKPFFESVKALLKSGRFALAFDRVKYAMVFRRRSPVRTLEQRAWKHLRKSMPKLRTEYDAAIAYLEGSSLYFCIDRTSAKRKLAYIHSDYEKLAMDADFDRRYFQKAGSVVTVSGACADTLRRVFPELADKIRVIENIISPKMIRDQAELGGFEDSFDGVRILTAGRLDAPKGIDLALEACEILVSGGYDIKWDVIGEGAMRSELERLIREKKLEGRFALLGAKSNPYPFMRQCDIYVQPSRFEGKSIAIEEAKCLGKPIVTTAFTTVRGQIEDGVTGLIAEISAEGIAQKVKTLLDDPALMEKLSENLGGYTGNESELDKFFELI
ncbi:MAG: glycosyltransferase [Oscillospiraceae bacterium]|nr:glycosyltransferase [Oscillospiraceae bacterium]